MTRKTSTIDAGYFDALYTRDADPWGFATSDYEREKYGRTLAFLSRARYPAALEVGCSIGVFTRRLAARCDRLTAIEASAVALRQARDALQDVPGVQVERGAIPGGLPEGPFHLIVLSEVLYYLDGGDARAAVNACIDRLTNDGEIVLCHWLGETNYPLSGDEAAELAVAVGKARGLAAATERQPQYRLDRLVKDKAGSRTPA